MCTVQCARGYFVLVKRPYARVQYRGDAGDLPREQLLAVHVAPAARHRPQEALQRVLHRELAHQQSQPQARQQSTVTRESRLSDKSARQDDITNLASGPTREEQMRVEQRE